MKKLNWSRHQAHVNSPGRMSFTTVCGETTYWVTVNPEGVTGLLWCVQDNHGAAWGEFATASEAMAAVEMHCLFVR